MNMKDFKTLTDNYNAVKYLVILEGKILYTADTSNGAEAFKQSLAESVREKVTIVTGTSDNKQILLG